VIDLHCHLLPGIDDGPPSLEDSVRLAAALVCDGVETVAATPHLRSDFPGVRPDELAQRVEQLSRELAVRGIPLEVVVGGELDMSWVHHASDEELQLVSFGQLGRAALLETPYGPLPHVFEHVVERLKERGYTILLAHPERSPTLQGDLGRLEALVAGGVLVQVTAGSLVADRSSGSRRLALKLIRRRLAHVLASDAHQPGRERRATLSAGARALGRGSRELAGWMTRDAPAALLAGEPVGRPPSARWVL
jgi:protein-tyrosine phosphatase